jgi:ketosteroid isomerase-like protein
MRCVHHLAVLFVLSSTICGSGQPKPASAAQDVMAVHKARAEAGDSRDLATWSRYTADDCIFSAEGGALLTKAELMERFKKLPREYDYGDNRRDYVVHVYGNMAVVNFLVTTHEKFTDTEIVTDQRVTETYVKQGGSWLLVARQWATVPDNHRSPLAVDPGVYQAYVGQYQSRPLEDVETISVTGGRLWSKFGAYAQEYIPLGADSFFIKPDLGTTTFSRDAQGRVTGYTYRFADGQEVHVKKIQ